MVNEQSHIEDQLLVMDAQEGDRKAMGKLVERWQKQLWGHAYRLTGEVEAAWEVTQQSWLAIIRGLRWLDDPAKFRGWIYRIVTNKSADWVRKQQKRRQSVSLDTVTEPAQSPAPESCTAELLNRLDVAKRTVLSLYYFEQLSVAEVGVALGIPAGTVKSRLSAARNALREILERDAKQGCVILRPTTR